MITLPVPDDGTLLKFKRINDHHLRNLSSRAVIYEEVLDEFGYYDVDLKDPSYSMDTNIYQKGKNMEEKINTQRFLKQKGCNTPLLDNFST